MPSPKTPRTRLILRWLICVLVAPIAAAILYSTFGYALWAEEGLILDLRVVTRPLADKAPTDIAVVRITPGTTARFPYDLPVDREFLADLLLRLQDWGVRAIALDMSFRGPTESGKDDRLKTVIRGLKVPLAILDADPVSNMVKATEAQKKFFSDFVPEDDVGFSEVMVDRFGGIARSMPLRRVRADGSIELSLLALIAKKLGISVPEGPLYISWLPPTSIDYFPPFFALPAQGLRENQRELFQGRIVLIGVDMPNTDEFRTPFTLIDGATMAGVMINAEGLATLLDKRPPLVWSLGVMVAVSAAAAGIGGLLSLGIRSSLLLFPVSSIFIGAYWVAGYLLFRAGVIFPLVIPTACFVLAVLSMSVYVHIQDLKKHRQ